MLICSNSQHHLRLHIADFVGEALERDQTRDPWLSGQVPFFGGDFKYQESGLSRYILGTESKYHGWYI